MLTYKTLGDAPRGFSLFFICFVALVIYNKLNMEKNIPSIRTLRISFLSGATEKICHPERSRRISWKRNDKLLLRLAAIIHR